MPKHLHERTTDLNIFLIPVAEQEPVKFLTIENRLGCIQQALGGYLTPVPGDLVFGLPTLDCGCGLTVFIDEDGKRKQLAENTRANRFMDIVFLSRDRIVGDALVIASGPVRFSDEVVEYDVFSLPPQYNLWSGLPNDAPPAVD